MDSAVNAAHALDSGCGVPPPRYGRARAVLILSLLFFAAAHVPFLPIEFPSDEGDNLLGGWLVNRGQVPYRDFWSQHTPFGYFYSALFARCFGRNWVIQRYAVALLGLVCFGYLLVRLIRGPDRTLFYAVALSAVLWPVYGVMYWSFMLLNDNLAAYPFLLGFGLVCNAVWNRLPLSRADNLALGLAAYVAVFSNPFTLFAILALLPAYGHAVRAARQVVPVRRALSWALGGGGVPVVLTAAYFLAAGSLGTAWQWVIGFNRTVYTQYHACPVSVGPVLRHQFATLLGLFSDIRWDFAGHFAEPMPGYVDDRWACLGLAGRMAVLIVCGTWVVRRQVLLGASLFGFALGSLLRVSMGSHAQHFRLLELFAESVMLVTCLAGLWRAGRWYLLVLPVAAVLVTVHAFVASRALATLREVNAQHRICFTLQPRGLPMTGGGEHLRNIMAGPGRLLAFPVQSQLNYASAFPPASYFYVCVPWTIHRAEDRARLLNDLRHAADENAIIAVCHAEKIFQDYQFADFADDVLAAIEQDYVEIQPGIYVSQSNPNRCQVPLRKAPLPTTPTEVDALIWAGSIGQGIGPHPRATFTLDRPEFVHRIHIRYVLRTESGGPARIRAWWRQRGVNDFAGDGRQPFELLQRCGAGEHVLCLPVGDVIDQFRIEPDAGPCRFEVRGITVVK